VRFDQHSNGLSDWDAEDVSFDAWLQNLETVTNATGHQRVTILGIFQGCSAAVAYTVRHPRARLALSAIWRIFARTEPPGIKRCSSPRRSYDIINPKWMGSKQPSLSSNFHILVCA